MSSAVALRNPAFCHTVHFYVLYEAHKNSDDFRNGINPSVFIINTVSVLCEVGTEFLHVVYMNVRDNLVMPRIRLLVSGMPPRKHGFDHV
jgi:hypothetical protein